MQKPSYFIVFLSVLLLFPLLTHSEDSMESLRVEEAHEVGELRVSLIVTPTGYYPKRLFVKKDIPVRIYVTSATSEASCFLLHIGSYAEVRQQNGRSLASAGSLRRTVELGRVEEVSFIPRKSGDYAFGCPIQGFQGTLTVRD